MGAEGASNGCPNAALLAWLGRGAVPLRLLPGTGKAESSRVPTPVCIPGLTVLGKLVMDMLAAYRERPTAG